LKTICSRLGDRWRITQGQTLAAAIHLAQGDLAGSEAAYRDALATAVDAHALPYALEALVGLADLYAQTERKPAAFAVAQRVQSHPAGCGPVKARAAGLVEQLAREGVSETAVAPSVVELLERINSSC
jgi:hypothetical protein